MLSRKKIKLTQIVLKNHKKKVSKALPQNNSETITSEHEEEILRERYIYIYVQKKDRKLLMNLSKDSSIIVGYQKRNW